MIEEHVRKALTSALRDLYGVDIPESQIDLKQPPNPVWGDIAFNCFSFAKMEKMKAVPTVEIAKITAVPTTEIAQSLAENLSKIPTISSVQQSGPYLNIRFNSDILFRAAVTVGREKDARLSESQCIMVEYLSPNTNKPLHLGHVRNGVLGSALANILEAVGHSVIRANLVNDRGIHICKSMIAWEHFANGATPESTKTKGDHFVGDWYVRYSQEEKLDPTLEVTATEMLQKWEAGDAGTLELWRMMNGWVYSGFAQTYERYNFRFDKEYHESDLYLLGKDTILDGLEKGVFVRNTDGAVVFRLDDKKIFGVNQDGSPKISTLLRRDGTSVYLTQDVGTAIKKVEDFSADRSVYVVASEQRYHFQVLFAILRALGYPWAERCYHFSYEMVELPDGRMKSREGNVVDADDLADHMAVLAQKAIRSRPNNSGLTDAEIALRAEKIALAAIKFYLLRVDPQTIIRFDPEKSLSFEGDTGPYCLYAYVRIRSILARAQEVGWYETGTGAEKGHFGKLQEIEERVLALNLSQLPNVIQSSAISYNPSMLADQILKIARSFNQLYAKHSVLSGDQDLVEERLALMNATAEALRWALSLLGIDVLEAM